MRKLFHVLLLLLATTVFGSAATLDLDTKQSSISVAVVTSVHDFKGEVGSYQTSINFSNQNTLPDSADVGFDFKDLKTGSNGRDKDMLKWLSYSTNPKVNFHLTGWKWDGTNSVATGELTLHGIKQSILMPTVVRQQGATIEIVGTAKLDYRDFKLPVIRKMFLFSVDPHLAVSFRLKGTLVDKK
jgi:polyisoprenoid-binding protein YceI